MQLLPQLHLHAHVMVDVEAHGVEASVKVMVRVVAEVGRDEAVGAHLRHRGQKNATGMIQQLSLSRTLGYRQNSASLSDVSAMSHDGMHALLQPAEATAQGFSRPLTGIRPQCAGCRQRHAFNISASQLGEGREEPLRNPTQMTQRTRVK